MKKKPAALILAALIISALLAGCGSAPEPAAPSADPSSASQPGDALSSAPPPAGAGDEDDGFIHVDSMDKLLNAIGPGAKISVDPGYYDLSDYAEDLRRRTSYISWDSSHPYVTLRDCFDGVEVVIKDLEDLTVTGGGDTADTEIVVDPRYATVLIFESCSNVSLSGLTMGHTDRGECAGNVLEFTGCDTVNIKDMDLYGCGVAGIYAWKSRDISVDDSVIRDCYNGPFEYYDCAGRLAFRGCELRDSLGGGTCWSDWSYDLSFTDCFFGEQESVIWYFRDDCTAENCSWSEISSYPDYEWTDPMADLFYPELFSMIPFDTQALEGTVWDGYAKLSAGSGDYEYTGCGMYSLSLNEDHSGLLETPERSLAVEWSCEEPYTLILHSADEEFTGSLYRNTEVDYGYSWLYMQIGGDRIWLY